MHDTPIHYTLNVNRYKQHLVYITLTFIAQNDTPILWMPSWIPGSYLMREFSRNITAVHYQIKDSDSDETDTLRAKKISKSEWQLDEIKAGQAVNVTYEVYCYDLSVRTAYVDQYRIYGNFTSLALAVEGAEDKPVQVILTVPEQFYQDAITLNSLNEKSNVKLVTGLNATHLHTEDTHQYSLEAGSYHDLIDFPFELSAQDEFNFIVSDEHHNAVAHRFYISGKHHTNMGRLQADLTQICQTYLDWLGDAPFGAVANNDYTFMTYASGNDYGGLEHINSTSLITPRADLPTAKEPEEPSEGYQRFLGLCSHEYFHAWWVKTVRPDVMMDVDLRKEAYTPLLWVFEGFTSYIDDFMLQASGVISKESYLKLLANQINRYTQTQGRHYQSVAESSFDAWIKLYRSDENTGNAGISYYNKGALVALCLDLLLIKHSDGKYRLFDVVKDFYAQAKSNDNKRIGMTDAYLDKTIEQYINPKIWQDFKARFVNGVEELPLNEWLQDNGIKLEVNDEDNTLPWGISVSESSEGLQVNKVLRDSVASEAGLSAKDIIVAIDGIKATKKQLKAVAELDSDKVSCHAFRRDALMTLTVKSQTASGITANPSLEKVSLILGESGYETWLKPSF